MHRAWLFTIVVVFSFFTASAPAEAAFRTTRSDEKLIYIPFLQRFVSIPKEWNTIVEDRRVIFEKRIANLKQGDFPTSRPGGWFVITPISVADCSITKLNDVLKERTAMDPKNLGIARESFTGISSSALQWREREAGRTIHHWCVIPIERVRAAEVFTPETDTHSKLLIRSSILRQLSVKARRTAR
jgi:hypothetical protein